MRILITNLVLWPRTGTVTYVRDLALGLRRRGHEVAVWSRAAGPVAQELRDAGVCVSESARDLPWTPDVIHGHHDVLVRGAIAAFPGVPAINVCHDHLSPFERTVCHPAVRRHFGVSRLCLQRQVSEGAPASSLALLPNFVDVERFRARPPLPRRPTCALVFSNYATNATHWPIIRDACQRVGVAVDVRGAGVGLATDCPEDVLPAYDVVFAKARAAIEAMAVGAAVVLCDAVGAGPMVRASTFDALQPLNFGREALTVPVSADLVMRRLAEFDPDDAGRVRDLVRARASLSATLDRLELTYAECVREGAPAGALSLGAHLRLRRDLLGVRGYWWWLSLSPAQQALFRRVRLNALARRAVAATGG